MLPYLKNCFFFCLALCVLIFQPSCNSSSDETPAVAARDTLKMLTDNQSRNMDQSPMDVSYCPAGFPQEKMKGNIAGTPVARVVYSRPHKKGRVIFSDDPKSLCQYGKPWRLGANESTEIQIYVPVMVSGKNINPGRYVLYCIPHPDKWEIIFNSNLDSWGLHIDRSKDLFQVEVPVQQQTTPVEDFTMLFEDTPGGAELLMTWDNVKVSMPLTFSR